MVHVRELRAMGATSVHVARGCVDAKFAQPVDKAADSAELDELRQTNHRLQNELELERHARRVATGGDF